MTHRLTQLFGLSTPLVLAPMALASGGALAAACAKAGALGLVGGGYGELAWTQREYSLAQDIARADADGTTASRIGIGFISWKLDEDASALDWVLAQPQPPAAVMLSFGSPAAYAARIAQAGAKLIFQVQRMDQVPMALAAGAQVLVAQGMAAGGHGMDAHHGRSTLTFVPELADWLAAHSPQTVLLAAGGIGDGRTLAASILLGADGALVGTRLWATQESLASPAAKKQALATDGDGTARSSIFDILRRKNWPASYDFRAIRNGLHQAWEGRMDELRANPQVARAEYDAGVAAADLSKAHVTVGEAIGLIHDLPSAGALIARMSADARLLLNK